MLKLFAFLTYYALALPAFAQTATINSGSFQPQTDSASANGEKEIQKYTNVIAHDSSNWLAFRQRGRAKNTLHQYKEAIKDFNIAISINPSDTFSYVNRGFAKHCTQDYVGAIKDYEKASKLRPAADYFFWLGMAHMALKKYHTVIKDLNKAIELGFDTTDIGGRYNASACYGSLAFCYMQFNNYAKAIPDYNKALTLVSDNPSSYYQRGYCEYKLQDYDNACKDMKLAFKMGYTYVERWLLKECK